MYIIIIIIIIIFIINYKWLLQKILKMSFQLK